MPSLSQSELFGRFASYLLTCFDAGELRRLIGYLPEGAEMARNLPSSEVSAAAIARAAVDVLHEKGYLHGKHGSEFWDSFKHARPRRVEEIDQWQAALRIDTPAELLPGGATAGPAGDPSAPDDLEILMVSASPIRARRQLAVDEEFGRILDKLRHRGNLRILQRTAVTFDRLQAALNDHAPQILHISCHGEPGFLHFEPERPADPSMPIPQEALVHTLDAQEPPLRLVVLNACDSLSIARRIVEAGVAEWAIGMNAPIYDHDAISFAATLYDTIAAGRSLDAAVKNAMARLMAGAPASEDPDAPHKIPQLVPDDRARAKKTFLVATPARARIE